MDKNYDVVIIGAGIGGLVCGCYLAQAGLRVTILEKNKNVGGYCSSFSGSGYRFNWCVHTLGSYREGGILNKILKEDLGIEKNLNIKRKEVISSVVTDKYKFNIYRDRFRTISELVALFPGEAENINNFFDYIFESSSIKLFLDLKDKLTGEFLAARFKNLELMKLLQTPAAVIGSKISTLPAFSFVICYRDTLFDGGYYADGGVQAISDALAQIFQKFGGTILNSTQVVRVLMQDQMAVGIETRKLKLFAKYVVSNIDLIHLCSNLVGDGNFNRAFIEKIESMEICKSAHITYLGVKKIQKEIDGLANSIYFSPECDTAQYLEDMENSSAFLNRVNLILSFPSCYEEAAAPSGRDNATILTLVPYKNKLFWDENKAKYSQYLIQQINNRFSGLLSNIDYMKIVTPIELEKYTFAHKGSIRGWASTLNNNMSANIPQGRILPNLFQVGQWTTIESGQGGIPMVASSGYQVARNLLSMYRNNNHAMGN